LSYAFIQRQHNNTNPITKEPLAPGDLITLHYSRKTSGEIHDPISFKPFSEHSHIVAIATTGNVFLAESIKGGKDLLGDVKFKKLVWSSLSSPFWTQRYYCREDVITLQNIHGLPPSSTINTGASAIAKKDEKPKPATVKAVSDVKGKAAVPCELHHLSLQDAA
jgi:peptidyl-prolyl cis-trans isomerase-like protein 2